MIKKLLLVGTMAIVSVSLIGGCGKKQQPSNMVNYVEDESEEAVDLNVEIYATTLDRFYTLIALGYNGDALEEDEMGVVEKILDLNSEDALNAVGYSIVDISGDEIPELIIGAVGKIKGEIGYGHEIYALYANKDMNPTLLLKGWSRNIYQTMKNGKFYYQGSSGAAYQAFGVYEWDKNGKDLECKDFYFSDTKNENYDEILFFHNEYGMWDSAISEKLDINEKAFWKIAEESQNQIYDIELTPFSKYQLSSGEQLEKQEQNEIQVLWAETALEGIKKYDEFSIESVNKEENKFRIAIFSEKDLKDFKILEIHLKSVAEDGSLDFDVKELYAQADLKAEKPLVGGLDFHEGLLEYGISYVDSIGKQRYFTLEISGMDGSLMMYEFTK